MDFLAKNFSSEISSHNLDLFSLAKSLGADIPYFLKGGLALVEGIGEKLTSISGPNNLFSDIPCVILIPNDRINTAQAFKLYRELNPEITISNSKILTPKSCSDIFSDGLNSANNYQSFLELCENDLVSPAELISGQVKKTLESFENDDLVKVFLTGSGSAMFVLPKVPKIDLFSVLNRKVAEKNIDFLKIIPVNLLV